MTEEQALDNLRDDLLAAKQLPRDADGRRLWPGCEVTYRGVRCRVEAIRHNRRLQLCVLGGTTERVDASGDYVQRVDK